MAKFKQKLIIERIKDGGYRAYYTKKRSEGVKAKTEFLALMQLLDKNGVQIRRLGFCDVDC